MLQKSVTYTVFVAIRSYIVATLMFLLSFFAFGLRKLLLCKDLQKSFSLRHVKFVFTPGGTCLILPSNAPMSLSTGQQDKAVLE